MHLFLCRHGEATHNVTAQAYEEAGLDPDVHVYPKWPERDSLLTNWGHKQAEQSSARFYQHKVNATDRVVVWTSPLRRAMQTAKAFFSRDIPCMFPPDKLLMHPGLREREFKHGPNKMPAWEDVNECFKPFSQDLLPEEPPEWWDQYKDTWLREETSKDLRKRAAQALHDVIKSLGPVPMGHAVIVTHNHILIELSELLQGHGNCDFYHPATRKPGYTGFVHVSRPDLLLEALQEEMD